MSEHKGTFLTFGDGSILITSGTFCGLPAVVLEPGHEGHKAGERANNPAQPYWSKAGDVILQFKNRAGMKILLEELQAIHDAMPEEDDGEGEDKCANWKPLNAEEFIQAADAAVKVTEPLSKEP